MSARSITAKILKQVVEEQQTLTNTFTDTLCAKDIQNETALIKEMSYGSLRWYIRLEFILSRLIEKPIKPKHSEIKYLLILGLYQLIHMDLPKHAIVCETVNACDALNKQWAKNFVNAVLRRYIRAAPALQPCSKHLEAETAHPAWMMHKLIEDWPHDWKNIIQANNRQPPMYLRVNRLRNSRAEYKALLKGSGMNAANTPFSATGLLLDKPVAVSALPGFSDGKASVQELAAQFSASLLDLKPGLSVLDACAAPGGKAGHILEQMPAIGRLTLVEKNPRRAKKLSATLKRLRLNASIKIADAIDIDAWWNKEKYDRILLDAPCSASGVIRRNPDIKLLRTEAEVTGINRLQRELLTALWALLKQKGRLVYATCSVFKLENSYTIKQFVNAHADCRIKPIPYQWGIDTGYGRQILTGDNNMDGFFYACLEKK